MKILIIAPLLTPVPGYEGYGGIQRAIYDITMRMALTDDITVFAPRGSTVIARIVQHVYETTDMGECARQVIDNIEHSNYDLVYSHIDDVTFNSKIAEHVKQLIIGCHYYFSPSQIAAYDKLGCWFQAQSKSHGAYLSMYRSKVFVAKQSVSIEDVVPSLQPLTATINGQITLPVLKLLQKRQQDYLLIVSRIGNHKGQDTAIKISKATGMPLVIAGAPVSVTEGDFEYFETVIKPQVNEQDVIYFGNANEADKQQLLRYAKATLLPTGYENRSWHEAFGRVVNESLACGTPVIAHNQDAMPEQIIHAVNGYLFTTIDEAVEYVRKVGIIDRQACVDSTITHLNADRFVRDLRLQFSRLVND